MATQQRSHRHAIARAVGLVWIAALWVLLGSVATARAQGFPGFDQGTAPVFGGPGVSGGSGGSVGATFVVFFPGDSVRLDAAAIEVIDLAAEYVRDTGSPRILLLSNPDLLQGDAESLASVRAAGVTQALRKAGLPPGTQVANRPDRPSRSPVQSSGPDAIPARLEIEIPLPY